MRTSNYQHVSTEKLRQAAEAEAQTVVLPPDWRNGRELREALAVDAAHSRGIDDAVSSERLSGGEAILRVSVADVGSFIAPYQDLLDDTSAMVAHAIRQAQTHYSRAAVAYPMLPSVISEDRLSLLHGQERPVITFHMLIDNKGRPGDLEITRDRIITERTTFDIVNDTLNSPGDDALSYKVQLLESIARSLFIARHDGDRHVNIALEDERGDQIAKGDNIGAQLIVQEAMIATGSLFAQYMRHNHIPALYRKHVVDPENMPAGHVPRKYLSHVATAYYGTFPEEHLGLNLACYLQGASPLRRIVDLAHHCNLVASLDGKEPPFNRERLVSIGRRMSRIKQKPGAIYEVGAQIEPSQRPKLLRPLTDVIAKVKEENPNAGALTTAFFGQAPGSAAELHTAQEAVIAHVTANRKLARAIILVAIQQGLLTVTTPEGKEGQQVLRDLKGQEYPYHTNSQGAPSISSSVKVLGKISGLEIPPEVKTIPARQAQILRQPHHFLQELHFRNGRLIHWVTKPPEDTLSEGGLQPVTVHILMNGKYYEATASHESWQQARNQACIGLIQGLNLMDQLPAKMTTDPHLPGKFRNYLHKRGLAIPAMNFQEKRHGTRSVNSCELNIIDPEGVPHMFTADAETKDAAKAYAVKGAFDFITAHVAAGKTRQTALAAEQALANDPPKPAP